MRCARTFTGQEGVIYGVSWSPPPKGGALGGGGAGGSGDKHAALRLASHAAWAEDPVLRGLLHGATSEAGDCPTDQGAAPAAALDASLLDALRLGVRLDDAGYYQG